MKNQIIKDIQIDIENFITDTNINRLSSSIRKILFDYISQNKNYLPLDFDLQLSDINMLFDLFDKINNSTKKKLK